MGAPPKRRAWLIAIGSLVAVVLALGGLKVAQISSLVRRGKAMVPPPETVTSAAVEADHWPVVQSAIGTMVAERSTRLSVEVTGLVQAIVFVDGAAVQTGDTLVHLDTRAEEAQLSGARADLGLAQAQLKRAQYLWRRGAAAQAELQAAAAREEQARAQVDNLEAFIAKKTVRAPFSGRIGIREVELGQIVAPGTAVASLQSVDPMLVEVGLPQRALGELEVGQEARVAVREERFVGRVITVNPELDPLTRNVRVRVSVANPSGQLLPGMFGEVEIFSGRARPVLVVPATAVLYAPYGDSVFVLKGDRPPLAVEQRFVRVSERRGDFVVISSGLKEHEQVVSSGGFKLRNGAKVVVDNALAPRAELEPQPENR
jgi:membrane fusion protein (multidrug efflux system)